MSSVTGEGFDTFLGELNAAVAACEARETTGLFRLWIERVFTIHGFGTVVSGIPSRGEVRLGDRLHVGGMSQAGRVRRMQVYGRDAEVARAGECVAINLADVDHADLARGQVLYAGDAREPVSMFEAELSALGHLPDEISDYTEAHVHIGTAEVMANLAMLAGRPLAPGLTEMVQVRLKSPLTVSPGERFVVRASMAGLAGGGVTTIGGGRVLGVSNKRLRRNRPWTLDALARRHAAIDAPFAWCALHLYEAGRSLSAAELARSAEMPLGQVEAALAALRAEDV
ncbi:MAG: hypothetical protein GY844_11970, partial [Bradyrhizobium sp.]|nr:hypothetical protein [Bradyrhizobium sp.]